MSQYFTVSPHNVVVSLFGFTDEKLLSSSSLCLCLYLQSLGTHLPHVAVCMDACLSSVETSWWSSVCTRGCFCHLKWPHSPCLLHDHADQSLDIMPVHSCWYRSTIMSHRWQPILGWRHSLAFSNVRRKGSDRQTNIFFLDFIFNIL